MYDGLRAYFVGHVYPTHPAWDRGAIAVIALCGVVVLIVLASLLIRARNGGINFLIKDSAMTRLEFRTFAPILFAVFAICECTQVLPFSALPILTICPLFRSRDNLDRPRHALQCPA